MGPKYTPSYEETLKSFSLRGNSPGEVDWVGQRAMSSTPDFTKSSLAQAPAQDILTKQTAQTVDMSQPTIGAMQASPNAALGVGGAESATGGMSISPLMAMNIAALTTGTLKDINQSNQNRINMEYQAKLAQINQDQENYRNLSSVYKV